jgi:hypothetical protein
MFIHRAGWKMRILTAAIASGLLMIPIFSAHSTMGFWNQDSVGDVPGDFDWCAVRVTVLSQCVGEFAGNMEMAVDWHSESTWICGPDGHTLGDQLDEDVEFEGVVVKVQDVEAVVEGSGERSNGEFDLAARAVFNVDGVPYVGTWSVSSASVFDPDDFIYTDLSAPLSFSLSGTNPAGGTFSFSGGAAEVAVYESASFSGPCSI